MDWAKDLTNIAVLFITVAALALIVSHASGTATVLNSGIGGFNTLLQTVENPGGAGGGGGGGAQLSLVSPSFAAFNAGGIG